MTFIIKLSFNRKKSQPFISVHNKFSNFGKKPRSSTISFDNKSLIISVCFLFDYSYFCVFGKLLCLLPTLRGPDSTARSVQLIYI